MENACAIFHKQFDLIYQLTNNYQQAVFLDKCIYWWQISKYTLGKNKIFFTRPYEQMAKEARISESSVNRYLKEFTEKGYIERVTKLSACNKGEFKVIKRTYIHITEKLLAILNTPANEGQGRGPISSVFLEQSDIIDNVTVTESIYKVKDHNQKNNSTVKQGGIVNNSETIVKEPPTHTPSYPIEPQIGERITDRLKNYIKGTLKNLQTQHALSFSDPNKLFAEVVFSATQDLQWPGIDSPHHRVNIIAKLLRQKQWKTPKGFYNHWDVGQLFRKKEELAVQKHRQQKIEEAHIAHSFMPEYETTTRADSHIPFENRFHEEPRSSKTEAYKQGAEMKKLLGAIQDVKVNLRSEETYLAQLEVWVKQNKPYVTSTLVEAVMMKVAKLYAEKERLEYELGHYENKAA